MPSSDSIRESHEIVQGVLDGKVDPQCQRAQRAYRVAKSYPNPDMVKRFKENRPVFRSKNPVRTKRRGVRQKNSQSKEVVMGLLFGSAAPQATRAFELLGSPRGQKAVGVGATVLTTLLITRMTQ